MIWPKCLDDMLGNALNDQLSDSDLSARITLFITISENCFSGLGVYPGKKLQGVRLVLIKGNNNVTNISGTLLTDYD